MCTVIFILTWELNCYRQTDRRRRRRRRHTLNLSIEDKPIGLHQVAITNIMCSIKEDGTYYNQFSRYFTTLYGMIHQKRGGMLRRGYRLKEQEKGGIAPC